MFFTILYLTVSALLSVGITGRIALLADSGLFSLMVLYLINHWHQLRLGRCPEKPEGSVDIFLPVVDEPVNLFKKTVQAAMNVDYDRKSIFILDDGNRNDIKNLAFEFDVNYLYRTKNTDYKAGNLNQGLCHSDGEYVLVLDADQVADPGIIRSCLGYFKWGQDVAVVSTRQNFSVPSHDFNRDDIFYENMQPGKNADNAAISCGSAVFYRRKALEDIGGFQTWNLVEDLYTTYVLHSHGYRSIYITTSFSKGLAPSDLPSIVKQRGMWATDTLRIFVKKNPVRQRGLTFRQKLHYLEMGWIYILSAVALPVLFTLYPLSLIFELRIEPTKPIVFLLRFLSLLLIFQFFTRQSRGNYSVSQLWISLFHVYLRAFIVAVLPGRPRYLVTQKSPRSGRAIKMVIPHLILILFHFVSLTIYLVKKDFQFDLKTSSTLLWTGTMIFWFLPILKKGFLKQ